MSSALHLPNWGSQTRTVRSSLQVMMRTWPGGSVGWRAGEDDGARVREDVGEKDTVEAREGSETIEGEAPRGGGVRLEAASSG